MTTDSRKKIRASAQADVFDVQADGLVGPTHNYAGLSLGNVASLKHKGRVANPREAALQGLRKMRLLLNWGVPQMLLPPLARPRFDMLHALGFRGSRASMLQAAAKADPAMLASVYSASSMWAANAATVTPGHEHVTGYAQVTPANLVGNWHRSLEAEETAHMLRLILPEKAGFAHHPPLPSHPHFGDEGAANHTRFCLAPEDQGLHVFVYGRPGGVVDAQSHRGKSYPARQSLAASQAIARAHGIPDERVMFLQQSREAITAGVFHNDVIAVGQNALWLVHEKAYAGGQADIDAVKARARKILHRGRRNRASTLQVLQVSAKQLPLADAVTSYLFNSQIVMTTDGEYRLICAQECQENAKAHKLLQAWHEQGHLAHVETVDLRQSMRNGGGPACLRLRLTMNAHQWAGVPAGLRLNLEQIDKLEAWVKKHYRDRLHPRDLLDVHLEDEVVAALEDLSRLLRLPRLYRI